MLLYKKKKLPIETIDKETLKIIKKEKETLELEEAVIQARKEAAYIIKLLDEEAIKNHEKIIEESLKQLNIPDDEEDIYLKKLQRKTLEEKALTAIKEAIEAEEKAIPLLSKIQEIEEEAFKANEEALKAECEVLKTIKALEEVSLITFSKAIQKNLEKVFEEETIRIDTEIQTRKKAIKINKKILIALEKTIKVKI